MNLLRSTTLDSELLTSIACTAAEAGQASVLDWCFTQGFHFKQPSFNDRFYDHVCSGHSVAILGVLLDHGFELNAHESEFSGDVLVAATRAGDVGCTRFLLEHGQDANDERTISPGELEPITYTIAWENASMENLSLLLEHGAKIEGTGAAIAAAETGNMPALRLLVERYGADLEERVFWGLASEDHGYGTEGTALYRACRFGKAEVVSYLLDWGADGCAKDREGTSCLSAAIDYGHEDVVRILEDHGIHE
ncbi:MAG: hypothetical protein Q9162_006550 [Coniocarpon cinnabarinum]